MTPYREENVTDLPDLAFSCWDSSSIGPPHHQAVGTNDYFIGRSVDNNRGSRCEDKWIVSLRSSFG